MLCVFVLLFKVVAGSACLADGQREGVPATEQGSTATVSAASPEDGGVCVLGEGEGCHCACAHAAPIPCHHPHALALSFDGFRDSARASAHLPSITGSLLRPPIA